MCVCVCGVCVCEGVWAEGEEGVSVCVYVKGVWVRVGGGKRRM